MDTESFNSWFSEHQVEITQRYVIDEASLSQVRGEMEQKYGFKATLVLIHPNNSYRRP